ncbi:MAG: DUF6671 family protein [Pseudomonadota bacterium]|nr:DUF6671 family protein [Pseudomonadota bacterium]
MKTAALLTKHRKSYQLAPVLYDIGIELVEIDFFDTDELGTFSGEIERQLSPRECALIKAKKAAELSGLNVGLGSEGSFGGGPLSGLLSWNQEIICLYQKEPELIIYASAEGPTALRAIRADSLDELMSKISDFDQQKWIVRCPDGILKGLTAAEVMTIHQAPFTEWPVTLEPDLRAMNSPLRQIMIQKAALNLAERMQTKCPHCEAVDFWPDEKEFGPACQLCGYPTNEVKSLISYCKSCGHKQSQTILETGSERFCNQCNP